MLARVSGAVGLTPARGRPLRCVLTAAVGRSSTIRTCRRARRPHLAADDLDRKRSAATYGSRALRHPACLLVRGCRHGPSPPLLCSHQGIPLLSRNFNLDPRIALGLFRSRYAPDASMAAEQSPRREPLAGPSLSLWVVGGGSGPRRAGWACSPRPRLLARDHGGMTEARSEWHRVTISDPQVMRALAHPARMAIIEHLSALGGGATATECAEIAGLSPSATSYHLRELAKFGLVRQAAGRGDARERVWQAVNPSYSVEAGPDADPETHAAEAAGCRTSRASGTRRPGSATACC
ncbi:ArsR/SmtB family transcription factor, partial [Micromonospora sp. NBS 11-29]|uniref:ArsR/SmtB family transcription factor n=1 Tax=Micromonospora sp. NBS 11-29 TaxID=1960879 RepID=UPI003F93F13F